MQKIKLPIKVEKPNSNCFDINIIMDLTAVREKMTSITNNYEIPIQYGGFSLAYHDKKMPYLLSDYRVNNGRHMLIWQNAFALITHENDMCQWKRKLIENLNKIRISTEDNLGLELQAKLRVFTSLYGEPNRCSLNVFSLDVDYECGFTRKPLLKRKFILEDWQIQQWNSDDFLLTGYYRVDFDNSNLSSIMFKVKVTTYKTLLKLYRHHPKYIMPSVYVFSNVLDIKVIEEYLHDTFKNIQGSSVDEIKLKLATFTDCVSVHDLIAKPFINDEVYGFDVVEV